MAADSSRDRTEPNWELSRNAKGQFTTGNAGGPGRPRKSETSAVPARVLVELAKPPDSLTLRTMAHEMEALQRAIEDLRDDFSIENRVSLSRLALKRLLELLMGN